MKGDKFKYLPQDMKWREMSIREADFENELFTEAFESMCKDEGITYDDVDYFFYLDVFKNGWKAAVRVLKDD